MNWTERANQAALIGLLRDMKAKGAGHIATLAGVEITAQRIPNRFGVPTEAETFAIRLSGGSWTVTARAVWKDGKLLSPVAVHAPILSYDGTQEDAEHGLDEAARRVNEWLRSCPERGGNQ